MHVPPRRVDERQSAHPLGVGERHLGGDLPAHRMTDQDRVGDAQGVEQGDDDADVVGVRVATGGSVREAEAAIVECDHPVAGGYQRRDRMPPGVHRRGEPVDQHHRRSRAGVDVTDAGPVHDAGVRREQRPGGPPRFRGQGSRPAGEEGHGGEQPPPGAHPGALSARRASSTICGWELHSAWIWSPAPEAVIT